LNTYTHGSIHYVPQLYDNVYSPEKKLVAEILNYDTYLITKSKKTTNHVN